MKKTGKGQAQSKKTGGGVCFPDRTDVDLACDADLNRLMRELGAPLIPANLVTIGGALLVHTFEELGLDNC